MILAIDPGTLESGWLSFERGCVIDCGIDRNEAVLALVQRTKVDRMAIEMVASYGMPVGREVFETVRWIGRFQQAWRNPEAVELVYRSEVKLHLCRSVKAKDANIRQALIDLIGPQGKKSAPGPTFGVSGHVWSALGVAATALKLRPREDMIHVEREAVS